MAMADAANFSAPFIDPCDPLDFPEDFVRNLTLPSDFLSDLDFDGDVHFSIEDLLDYTDADPPHDVRSGGSESNEGSGVLSLSPASGNGTSSSSVSGNSGASSPYSGNSAAADANVGNTVVEVEEREKGGLGLKRKKERADGLGKSEVNTNGSEYIRSGKFRRSGLDEASSPCLTNVVNDDGEKRRARLIRNRESAQLSRQRKKHYVEELEEKVRSMHSMITDLNGKISYFIAENASLRQQLSGKGGNSGKCPPPSVYPAVPPMAHMPYPWLPCSGYALRPPVGTQVPLVPIPRLKPQQSASVPKPKKIDGKKAQGKFAKKVASVSLLGLLAFIFFIGIFVPGVGFREVGYGSLIPYGYTNTRSGIINQYRGRILSLNDDISNHKQIDNAGLCGKNGDCMKNNIDKIHDNTRSGLSRYEKQKEVLHTTASLDRSSPPANASEPLLASLYVPRNKKLVKIDGNLIISSVLASEKATAHTSSEFKSYKTTQSSERESRETSLAISRNVALSLAVHKSGRNAGRQSHMYRSSNEYHRALPHGYAETHTDNSKSTSGDGPLKEWFREGLEGPVFRSGMCTEVFQFNVAPASGDSGGIIPAASVVNASDTNAHNSSSMKMKNRRNLYSQPIPLNGSKLNSEEGGFAKPRENSSFHHTESKSMVVSVLVDPREAGDGDGEGMMQQPKSISRIFVVVLIDSVKYITYSCVLPFKSSVPHIQ